MPFIPEPGSLTRRKPRVLLAEDDDEIRAVLACALQLDGYDVIEMRSGHEAIEFLSSSMILDDSHPPPDAIITDVRMPGISGMTLLAGLRACGWATPVIVITAYDIDAVRAKATNLGANVFAKPFDVADVCRALTNLLRSSVRANATDG